MIGFADGVMHDAHVRVYSRHRQEAFYKELNRRPNVVRKITQRELTAARMKMYGICSEGEEYFPGAKIATLLFGRS